MESDLGPGKSWNLNSWFWLDIILCITHSNCSNTDVPVSLIVVGHLHRSAGFLYRIQSHPRSSRTVPIAANPWQWGSHSWKTRCTGFISVIWWHRKYRPTLCISGGEVWFTLKTCRCFVLIYYVITHFLSCSQQSLSSVILCCTLLSPSTEGDAGYSDGQFHMYIRM